MKYPIGVQSFENMRTDDWYYVDKTAYVHKLVSEGKYYFLSRPRRFGKSLFLSTLAAYFRGQRELFRGLALDKLATDWQPRPVLHLDLNDKYTKPIDLHTQLNVNISHWEDEYGADPKEQTFSKRFAGVIERAAATTGRKVVVLVDEYDKPIQETFSNRELQEEFRNELRGLYSVLKSQDHNLHFVFLTGITKISHLNIFSGMNNIKDISMSEQYAEICGLTEDELHGTFGDGIMALAKKHNVTYPEMSEMLRRQYDGYHFTPGGAAMYNPYSLVNAFFDCKLGRYWFSTATPSALIEVLPHSVQDLSQLDEIDVETAQLESIDYDLSDPIPLMYQSGYLTIKGYDIENDTLRLGFPNGEVRKGFQDVVIPHYVKGKRPLSMFNVTEFRNDLVKGDVDGFMLRLKTFLANMDYSLMGDKELYFHNVFYALLMLLGVHIEVEKRTDRGRIDAVIKTKDYIYIFEFKLDSTADKALRQIEDNGYAEPYALDPRRKIRIGCAFSSKTHNIRGYRIA